MKMSEAKRIMDGRTKGYRVHFESVQGCCLLGDFFPDRGEELIPTENEAWYLAHRFASRTRGRCVNIYVVDEDYKPVEGYEKIKNR